MKHRTLKLAVCLVIAVVLLTAAYNLRHHVQATTNAPDYRILLPGDPSAPMAARAAPYGQWIVTHNSVSGITTTENYGTVARTNGYDATKRLICYNSGDYTATVNLYLRTTSTGNRYNLDVPLDTVNPSTRKVIDISDVAPWMTVGITSTDATTGTTMLCGIYVQTP
jgi:hypothetical protein